MKIFYPLKVLWSIWWFLVFAISFLMLYPLFLILLSNEKRYAAANDLRRFWGRIIFIFSGIIWKVQFEQKLDKNKTYIFCPNHFSYLDIPMFVICFNGNFRYMAKMELDNIPLFNIFFRTVDIPVNRGNYRESHKSLLIAQESLKKGMSLVIFPEGTIGPNPPQLLNFKNGPFRLAIENEIAIVPITFPDNWKLLHVEKKFWGRPGIARAIVHAPIETKGMQLTQQNELRERVYNIISDTLKKHS